MDSGKMREVLRFILVGLAATAIQYLVYLLLLGLCGPSAALTIGYVVSLVFNFLMTTYFTFSTRPTVRKAGGFVLAHLVNCFLQLVFLHFFVWLGVPEKFAPVPMYAVCFPVNFLLVRFFVKRNNE